MSNMPASAATVTNINTTAPSTRMRTLFRGASIRSQTSPLPLDIVAPHTQPSTLAPRTPVRTQTPVTPQAPRKRPRSKIDPFAEPRTPTKRICSATPTPQSTPTKRRRKPKTPMVDRVVCIPLSVLREHVDDTSALLRPPPKRIDEVARIVKCRMDLELARIRAGFTGILAPVSSSPQEMKGKVKKE